MNGTPDGRETGGGDAWARDRLAAVAFVASLISHDARNRLASVRAALELIEAGLEANLTPEYRAALLRELDDFIGDFNLGLEMVRCHQGTPEPVSIREIVDESVATFRPYADRSGVKVTAVFAHAADVVRTDRRLLRLTLLNLLRNAAEALAETPRPRILLRTSNKGDRLNIEVEDNGPGVPEKLHDKFFLRASDTGSGAGLGLSLCRDAVAVMGGSISHITPRGKPGACFRVSVPRGE
jgi:two-component system sensor histidine kinase KdpD